MIFEFLYMCFKNHYPYELSGSYYQGKFVWFDSLGKVTVFMNGTCIACSSNNDYTNTAWIAKS